MGERRIAYKVSGRPEGKRPHRDLSVDGRVILHSNMAHKEIGF
jgi:hypothetical protein